MKSCPCCGQPLQSDIIAAIACLDISPAERRILLRLAESFGEAVGKETLIKAVWWDDIDGGPLDPANVLSVHIHNLRPKLTGIGMAIESKSGKRGRRLVWAKAA